MVLSVLIHELIHVLVRNSVTVPDLDIKMVHTPAFLYYVKQDILHTQYSLCYAQYIVYVMYNHDCIIK